MSDMDKILRGKIYDYGTPTPDDMWNRIESELGRKKRRFLPLLWIGGLASVGIILAFMLLPESSTLEGDLPATDKKMIYDGRSDGEKNNQEMVTKTENLSEEPLSEIQPKHERTVIQSKIIERKTPTLDHLSDIQNSKSTAKTSIRENSSTQLSDLKLPNPIPKNSKISVLANLSNLPLANIDIEERKFSDPIGCPTFSSRNIPNIFIEAYYKPLFAYSLLGSNSAEVGESYLNLRRSSESPLYSWAAGAYVGWISNYNLGLKAGAEYEVINERFEYLDPEAIRNQTVITIDTTFNPDGSFNISSDTSVVQVSGTELQSIHNYHKSLSIPIHALYQLSFRNLALEFSGGPIFNINYTNRGKIVDPSNEDQWFTKGESGSYDVFKDRLSVSFSLSISAMYSISERIQIYARPEFKFFPSSLGKISSPFTQKYLNSGVSVGARYYFSGNPNY